MLKGVDPTERIEHISRFDKDEPKTVFVLRPLTGVEVPEGLSNKADVLKALKTSIVEIRNKPEGMTDEQFIERLDLLQLGELLSVFNKLNGFTGETAKN